MCESQSANVRIGAEKGTMHGFPTARSGATPACRLMPTLLLCVSALALGWILLPFYGAIMWSLIIAMLFAPVYRWRLPRLGRRRNCAAGLVMLPVLVVGALPFALMTASPAKRRLSTNTWVRVNGIRHSPCVACSTRCLPG